MYQKRVCDVDELKIWLRYDRTSGRPSLMRPLMGGGSDFRPASTQSEWDITSNICYVPNLNLVAMFTVKT